MRLDDHLRLLISVALLLLTIASLLVLATACGKMPTEDSTCKKAVTVLRNQLGDSLGVVEWTLCGGATLAG